MLWALFSTIIASVSRVLFKKTTYYKLSTEHNELIGLFWWIIWIYVLFLFWLFDLQLKSNFDYFIIFALILFFHPVLYIRMYVFSKEKISTLVPYQNISPILTVIFAFIFLWENISHVSFWIFILIISLLIYSSTRWKSLVFNKNIFIFVGGEFIVAMYNVLVAYVLIWNLTSTYFIVYILSCLLIYSWIVFLQYMMSKFQSELDKTFYTYRLLSSMWWTSWLIWIILITEYWIIVTTLLWFFWLAVTLLSSYLIYRDIPSKKDLLVTITVSVLVEIWFLFR